MWPVTEIVTYGFSTSDAPLDKRGIHLSPSEFHKRLTDENTVCIDVRNFNETLIGKFQPKEKEGVVIDPCMRKSTEFPEWVVNNLDTLKNAKQVLMYCTAGVRCERASAFLKMKGLEEVYQLDGGIHRYLDAFPDVSCIYTYIAVDVLELVYVRILDV